MENGGSYYCFALLRIATPLRHKAPIATPEPWHLRAIATGFTVDGQFSRLFTGPEEYNVRPPRYLSWFITPITMVYGTYNYRYWGL